MGSSTSKSDNNFTESNIDDNKKVINVLIDDKNKITINKDFNSHSSNKLIDAQKTPSDDNKNTLIVNNHKTNSNLTRSTHKQLITSRYIPKKAIMNNREKGLKSNSLESILQAKYLGNERKSAFDFRGIM